MIHGEGGGDVEWGVRVVEMAVSTVFVWLTFYSR